MPPPLRRGGRSETLHNKLTPRVPEFTWGRLSGRPYFPVASVMAMAMMGMIVRMAALCERRKPTLRGYGNRRRKFHLLIWHSHGGNGGVHAVRSTPIDSRVPSASNADWI